MKPLYLFLWFAFGWMIPAAQAQSPSTCAADFTQTISGNQVHFVPVPNSTAGLEHAWFFGDGNSSSLREPTHTYAQCGTYIVRHRTRVLNPNGVIVCADSVLRTIQILCTTTCNLQANFNFSPVPNQPNTFLFTNSSIGLAAGDSIRWTFGDGSPASADLNPTHTFPGPGSYQVCLRLFRASNTPNTPPCVREFCRTVVITPSGSCQLVPRYSIQIPNPAQPNVLVFTNTSSTPGIAPLVSWNFGDGSSATGPIVTHVFNQTGPFNVCMRITVSNTCSADTCGPVTVTMPNACNLSAAFSWQLQQSQPNSVQFTNNSQGMAAGDSIVWTFGDGNSSNLVNPAHNYSQGGVYNVCLRIFRRGTPGSAPCVSETCRLVAIPGSTGCNINPGFIYQVNPNTNWVVTFTNTSITANAPQVSWNFGDGTSGNGNIVTHTYQQPGTYRVCMRITVSNTCSTDTCINITVGSTNPPACALLASFSWQINPNQPAPVAYFLNTSAGFAPGDSIRWSFGDGQFSTLSNPVHTFPAPGTYRVCIRVKKNGLPAGTTPCISETCRLVTVGSNTNPPLPCDSIRVSYTYRRDAFMPNRIYFITLHNYPVLQETWTITNLSNPAQLPIVLNQYNPSFVFPQTGTYRVCLRAVTQGQCIREYCDSIQINQVSNTCQIMAYPNPATTQVSVNVALQTSSTIQASLYNTQNMMLQQIIRQGVPGSNVLSFPIGNLPAGYYTIRVYYNGQVCVSRFQKL